MMRGVFVLGDMPFDQIISGRVTARDKKLLKDSGYNVRDAVEYFIHNSISTKQKLVVEKHFILKNIKSLNEEIESLKMDVIDEEMRLEKINNQLGVVEINGNEYSVEINRAVDNVIQRYSRTSMSLEEYFVQKHLFVENQAAIVEIDVDELEDLVKEKLCKQGEFTL